MKLKTLEWRGEGIRMIDQTQLPLKLKYVQIKDIKSLWRAIKIMQVRGAPALGAAAALGVYLGVKDSRAKDFSAFRKDLERVIKYLASSRPTARNLFWGLEQVKSVVLEHRDQPIAKLKRLIFSEGERVIAEDRESCRRIGRFGARLINDRDTILTVCNAGILATIDYGTALGVIYRAKEEGKRLKVFSCETRPMLQGARLTTWELKQNGVDVTMICDSMAASLMRAGKIDRVIAGADRIAANGDTANKIGTYSLAVLSRYHRIPFYIAAPQSTFDLSMKSGKEIVIEERPGEEATKLFFKEQICTPGVKVYNPAFDVTDHQLITGIITDKGVIRPPYQKNIAGILGR